MSKGKSLFGFAVGVGIVAGAVYIYQRKDLIEKAKIKVFESLSELSDYADISFNCATGCGGHCKCDAEETKRDTDDVVDELVGLIRETKERISKHLADEPKASTDEGGKADDKEVKATDVAETKVEPEEAPKHYIEAIPVKDDSTKE